MIHQPGSPIGALVMARLAATLSDFDVPVTFGFQRKWAGPWPHYDEEGKWCNCVTY